MFNYNKRLNAMIHEEKLTASEEEVMERIWSYGPCAPKDIVELYDDPKPHVNTVATMFQSLERKGFLTHVVRGRGYIYTPIVRKEDYGRNRFSNFVKRYFNNSYMNVVSALVHDDCVSREELEEFLANLKQQRDGTN